MAVVANHIINKQTINIQVDDMAAAKAVNAGTKNLLQTQIPRLLGEVFDELDPGTIITFDKLHIHLSFSSPADFTNNFALALKQKIHAALAQQIQLHGYPQSAGEAGKTGFAGDSPDTKQPKSSAAPVAAPPAKQKGIHGKTVWDTFEYYLQYGVFPWWFATAKGSELAEELKIVWPDNQAALGNKIIYLLNAPGKFRRFTELIPENKLGAWAQLLSTQNGKELYKHAQLLVKTGFLPHIHLAFGVLFYAVFMAESEIRQGRGDNYAVIRQAIRHWFEKTTGAVVAGSKKYKVLTQALRQKCPPHLQAAGAGEILQHMVVLVVKQVSKQKLSKQQNHLLASSGPDEHTPQNESAPKKITTPRMDTAQPTPRPPENPVEGILVTNAGLVLCWPFLPALFEKAGLVQQGEFINHEARQRAVVLLHYIVHKQLPGDEHALPLNKVLCGLLPADEVPVKIAVGENWEKLGDEMWQAMLRNWDKMKSTSVRGLIESFILREGILKPGPMGRKLTVERKALDVLLSFLPWPLSIIKLKWSKEMITVTW